MKYFKSVVILSLVVLNLNAGCWNDSECPSSQVCECSSSSSTGNCDAVGKCVDRDKYTQDGIKSNDKAKANWTYIVKHVGSDLEFSFTSNPSVRTIRHHTSSGYVPYVDLTMKKGDKLIVSKGQWLHGAVNNNWSYLIDADNR
ncbi:hypothetical protein [Sulfurimonas sp.]|uniref:hypothetical protein n=1 Tax=Sulfurimonas sp. TaxID=2022749 RepID=UPI003D0B29DA